MSIIAIVAATPDWVIGRNGDMPWRLSTDLRRFKRLTLGSPMLMGRKTFDSIGRPLPGRETCVLTRQTDWSFPEVTVVHTVEAAIAKYGSKPRFFIVGGAEIYAQTFPFIDEIYLTKVWTQVTGDTFLRGIDFSQFDLTFVESIPAGPKDDAPTEFQIWRRRVSNGRVRF